MRITVSAGEALFFRGLRHLPLFVAELARIQQTTDKSEFLPVQLPQITKVTGGAEKGYLDAFRLAR